METPLARTVLRLAFTAALFLAGCESLNNLSNVPDAGAGADAGGGTGEGGSTTSDGGSAIDGASNTDGSVQSDGAPPACNADTQTSLEHCGACGVDCREGECSAGICTLTPDLLGLSHMAIRDDRLYLTLWGSPVPTNPLRGLLRCPSNGCKSASVGAEPMFPDASTRAYHVATTATHVFATNFDQLNTGGVNRVNITGGGFTHLPTTGAQTRSYGVATDATHVYWVENGLDPQAGALWSCPLAGCTTAQHIVDADSPELLAVLPSGRIVWSELIFGIKTCPSRTDCAQPTTILAPGYPNAIALDANVIYWGHSGNISSCATAPALCSSATTIMEGTATEHVTALAVSGSTVYWATLPFEANKYVNGEGKVFSCTIGRCSGTGIRVIATKQAAPTAMVLDARSVYWANEGKRGFTDGFGQVRKAPR